MARYFITVFAWIIASSVALPVWAMTNSIAKDQVNVRVGPSLNHDVIFMVSIGYPVEIEKQKGQWVMIKDFEGDSGWVSAPLLSDTQTVVVQVKDANVRSSPGLQHVVVTQAHKGEIYRFMERQGDWVKIGYFVEGNEVGWIRQDLVSLVTND